MKDRITVFSINITIKIPLRFFAFRLCRCSTVKIGSQREKLSLKTLIIQDRIEEKLIIEGELKNE